jgi:hypothetical protein
MSNHKKHEGGPLATLKTTARCAFSGGAGLLAGHVSCVATPLAMTALGMTGAVASSPVLAVGVGAAVTATSLGTWYSLRGCFAAATEKKIVTVSAAAGLALMSTFNLTGGHQALHHGSTPHQAMTEDAQSWYNSQTPAQRDILWQNAQSLGLSLEKYINDICASPTPAPPLPENRLK